MVLIMKPLPIILAAALLSAFFSILGYMLHFSGERELVDYIIMFISVFLAILVNHYIFTNKIKKKKLKD